MPKIFHLNELLTFAVEREKMSFDLYTKLAEQTSDAELKALFERLAKEEIKHEAFYQELLNVENREQNAAVPQDEEYHAYMETLIEQERTSSKQLPKDFKNLKAVLDYAIAREQDAILFYVGLKNYVPTKAHEKVDRIIKEEMRHAAILEKVKTNY